MRATICLLPLVLVFACNKKQSCATQPVEKFIGSSVPVEELRTALTSLAARGKVCGPAITTLVFSGSRSETVEAFDVAMKGAGFHDVPGRSRVDVSTVILSYAKKKTEKDGDLVEFAVSAGEDCRFGDVCVENYGYSVVPN